MTKELNEPGNKICLEILWRFVGQCTAYYLLDFPVVEIDARSKSATSHCIHLSEESNYYVGNFNEVE